MVADFISFPGWMVIQGPLVWSPDQKSFYLSIFKKPAGILDILEREGGRFETGEVSGQLWRSYRR